MSKRMSISEARQKLFELVEYVSTQEEAVVFIEHRDKAEKVVLLSEARLRFLETHVRELKKQKSSPFNLAGSITSELSDEALEASLKTLQKEASTLTSTKHEAI